MFEVRFARQRGPPSALLQLTGRVCVTCARGASRRGEGGRLGVRRRLLPPASGSLEAALSARPRPISRCRRLHAPRAARPCDVLARRTRRAALESLEAACAPLTADSPPPQASRGRRPSRSTKTCRCLRGGKSSTNLGESRIKSRANLALSGCRGGARHREGARDQAGGADRRHLHRTRPA